MKKLLLLMCVAMFALTSCQKENEEPGFELRTQTLSVTSGQTAQLRISPSAEGCTYESNEKFTALVSTTGKVTGFIIGTTSITVFDPAKQIIGKCAVTVSPQYSMYKDPHLVFGATQSEVKSYETRKLLKQTTTAMSYQGENSNISQVAYTFENGRSNAAGCLVPISKTGLLTSFLAERYIYLGKGTGDILAIFISVDKKTAVGIAYTNLSYLTAIYIPNKEAKSKSSDDISAEFAKYIERTVSLD